MSHKPLLLQRLILFSTDYELACSFERELCWLDPVLAHNIEFPIALTYPAALSSPLIAHVKTFGESREDLGLSLDAAEILDEVRPLTIAITSPFSKVLDVETITSGQYYDYPFERQLANRPQLFSSD